MKVFVPRSAVQPLIDPGVEANRKVAALPFVDNLKAFGKGLNTWPVGFVVVTAGMTFKVTVAPLILSTLDVLVTWLDIQKFVVGPNEMPHGLIRLGSVNPAWTDPSEI